MHDLFHFFGHTIIFAEHPSLDSHQSVYFVIRICLVYEFIVLSNNFQHLYYNNSKRVAENSRRLKLEL